MESGFCGARQALGVEKPIAKSIRPSDLASEEKGDWEDAEEEGRKIKGQESVAAPSQHVMILGCSFLQHKSSECPRSSALDAS